MDTIDNSDAFGNMVLYKAHQKQLHTAKRKAYIGDGDIKIWTIYEDYFRPEGWTPILDFVHAVEYAFESAKLSTDKSSLKGILKLKASLLSHDDSFQQFWDNRYEHQVSTKRSYLRRAA